MVAGEFVDEDDGRAGSGYFLVQFHAVIGGHVRLR